MKNIQDFLKASTDESSMRLAFIRSVNTAIFIGITITLGAVTGFILGIIMNNDKISAFITTGIGALSGLGTALVGAFLIPAFGGKAIQSFPENSKNNTSNNNDEEK